MKLPFAMLCLAGTVVCYWIAFHDIGELLNGESPTVANVFGLVSNNFARS